MWLLRSPLKSQELLGNTSRPAMIPSANLCSRDMRRGARGYTRIGVSARSFRAWDEPTGYGIDRRLFLTPEHCGGLDSQSSGRKVVTVRIPLLTKTILTWNQPRRSSLQFQKQWGICINYRIRFASIQLD